MASRSKIILVLLAISSLTLTTLQAKAETKVKYKADNVTYEKGVKKAKLLGNVQVNVEETLIVSEQIDVDLDEKIVSTDLPFEITTKREGKDTKIIGKGFNFNIETKRLVAKFASLETDADAPGQKVYISGEEITIYDQGASISVTNGDFTTCDYIEKTTIPHYSIKGTTIDFIPNDRVIAWNSKVFVMGKQTFWYPFFYLPLKKDQGLNDFKIDAGKNEVEGMFANFSNHYVLNDYHEGNVFWRIMEKKWLGFGFEHAWTAFPTSASYLFAFGNPINSRYFLEPNQDLKANITPVFEDREVYFRHEQWLPILPHAQSNFTFHTRNFYNTNSILQPRDDFNQYNFDFFTKEIFQPAKNFNIEFNPDFKAGYRQQRNSTIDSTLKIVPTSSDNVLNLSTNTSLKFNELNFNLNSTLNNTIRQQLFQAPASSTQPTTTTGAATNNTNQTLNYFKSGDNVDFNNNLSLNYNILPNLNMSASTQFINNDIRNFNQPSSANLPSIQTSSDTLNQQLNSKLSLTQNLDWGNLSVNMEHRNDYLDNDLFPRDALGNLIPEDKLTTQEKERRDKALLKRKSGNYINKLPELNLNLNPFFKDYLPVTVSGSIGRYLEASRFRTTNLSNTLQDIVRTSLNVGLDSKELDLGLGNKVNLGGTGYQQNFYQTQDAQYSFTGQFNYKNDFLKYLTPEISYRKVITDEKNNSPFAFDRLARNKQDNLIGSLGIGNIPEFNFRFSNIGYDYQNKSYLSPINVSLNSEFISGARFIMSAQSGYRINNITKEAVNRQNVNFTNIADKEKMRTDANSTLSDTAFGKKYVGATKQEALNDLNTLTDDQLLKKYSIDNRLYDALGREVVSNTKLTEADIGKFEIRGGKIEPVNLSFGVGTPWEFGSDSFFGKEKDIPWGIAGLVSSNIDLISEDFYKPTEVNGIEQPITSNQQYINLINRFQNTSGGLLFVIGGSWLTHTHIELNLTFIPPELVPVGSQPQQTNRPWFPFNTSISFKKDLHDFILSFDLLSQYVPAYNKRDFLFSLNLEMTAFPFSTKKLTDDLSGSTRNLSNLGNQINNF